MPAACSLWPSRSLKAEARGLGETHGCPAILPTAPAQARLPGSLPGGVPVPDLPVGVHGVVPRRDRRHAAALARLDLPRGRPAGRALHGALDRHPVPRPALEPGHPRPDLLPRPLLLRLDLPARHAEPLLRQPAVGEEARQGAHRLEPLQALAGRQVLRARGRAPRGPVRFARRRPRGPHLADRPLAVPLHPAGGQLRRGHAPGPALRQPVDGRPPRRGRAAVRHAGHAGQLPPAPLQPGGRHRADLRRPAGPQPPRHPFLVPGALSPRRAAGPLLALVAAPPRRRTRAAATSATSAWSAARGATTRSPGRNGARRSATCASTASAGARPPASRSSLAPRRRRP